MITHDDTETRDLLVTFPLYAYCNKVGIVFLVLNILKSFSIETSIENNEKDEKSSKCEII